ncbi:hypothetical protein Ddye_004005 [Dipteronia dyeriana]|uniref:GATA transcription factor n=1 Tax=Dipteronia dyeriana TaxID=168575 RepID=A0AAD9XTB6_9ROSI|nr:hypothetical protein Ddye_004005 [Dipteronia dyeriana]
MEGCTETTARALKSSLRRELATQQVFLDDVLFCATGISGGPGEEYFSVDDLLDFSNGDFEEEEEEEEEEGSVEEEEEDEKDSLSGSSSQDRTIDIDDNNSNSSSLCASQPFLTHELVEPVDDFAELEWVSHFVDDSSPSELSLLYPSYVGNRSEPELNKPVTMIKTPCCFPSSVPSKARTKRARPAGRVWSLVLPVLADSPVSSSSSSRLSPSPTHEWLSGSGCGGFEEPAAKKLKRKPAVQTGGSLFQRRCSHCQIQKTPQWRTGPLGPKTLCNACGVRFKSGRLFPEYRPACSPTFSRDVHSNSHRKVLEMRKKKELTGPEVGLTQMVQSF